jgi:cysteinyl-tRNA synthetase
MSFDQNAFQAALKHVDRFSSLWATVEHFSLKGELSLLPSEDWILLQLQQSKTIFEEALSRDLNTPLALSAMLKLAQATASHLDVHGAISRDTASLIHNFLKTAGTVLFGNLAASELELKNYGVFKDLIEFVIEQRDKLRAEGKYDDGDLVRARLERIGITLQDLSKTTIWRRVHREEKSQC